MTAQAPPALGRAGRIGVWGASGSGKSTHVRHLIRDRRRVVVLDPLAEYAGDGLWTVVEHRRAGLDGVRRAIRDDWRAYRIVYVPPVGGEVEALSALCRLLLHAQRPAQESGRGEGLTLVAEELATAYPVHGGAERCAGMSEVCARGRHYGIEVIGVSQRVSEVATRLRGNLTGTTVLRQRGPRDVTAAADLLGVDRRRVAALGPHEALRERDGRVDHVTLAADGSPRSQATPRRRR